MSDTIFVANCDSDFLHSVSGPSATVYAYLGEFHAMSTRSRVMMLASSMYGVFCLWNPVFAMFIINQEWSFYIAPLDLVFKPWRLFMIVCGMPSVVCALVTLIFMPESPKFLFGQGEEEKTLQVLQKVYRCNSSKPSDTFPVKSLVKDEEFQERNSNKSRNLFEFMWSQTTPLFRHPHLRNTLTICFMQFCIFNTSNGLWTFFPEITNRITLWEAMDPSHVSATVCTILDETKSSIIANSTVVENSCVTKLADSVFVNAFILNFLYIFGWFFLAMIINRMGKLVILTTLFFSASLSAISLVFVDIPILSMSIYIYLLGVGLALTVLNAVVVELFPTNVRYFRRFGI